MLKGLAGLAVLGIGGGTATKVLLDDGEDGPAGPALTLATHGQSDMDALELAVSEDVVRRSGPDRWRSSPMDASAFSMVAFVWPRTNSPAPAVRVRVRRDGAWGGWWSLPPAHDAPDPDVDGGPDHAGTEIVWVGLSNGLQFEVSGALAPGMELVLLHPRRRGTDGPQLLARESLGRQAETSGDRRSLRPAILTRTQWGADESWRSSGPTYNHSIQQVHIHHTASGNDYSRADVPGLIRGMYRYHTHNLGWSDIAYNFLVDRFGRVWEGRAGGVGRRVRGAHTLGFNATSTGIAVIGNFDLATPGEAIIEGVASVAAWKIHKFGGRPRGTTEVRSEGSDKFAQGQMVTLPVIDGHRDTNDTACPGGHLYALLPKVRRRTKALINAADEAPAVVVKESAIIVGSPEVGETLTVSPGVYDPADVTLTYTWLRDGQVVTSRAGSSYACAAADFGTEISVRIEASAPDRTPITETLVAESLVTARPALELTAVGGNRRVRVWVRVASPEGVAATPAGQVVVRLGEREKVAQVVEGVARVSFYRVRAGQWPVTARYTGGGGFASTDAATTVNVRHDEPGR